MFSRDRLKLWGRKSRSNVHDSVFNSSGGVIVESCWIKINVQRAACFLSVTSLIDKDQLCYCSIPSKELHEKEIMMWLEMFWRHFIIYFARKLVIYDVFMNLSLCFCFKQSATQFFSGALVKLLNCGLVYLQKNKSSLVLFSVFWGVWIILEDWRQWRSKNI